MEKFGALEKPKAGEARARESGGWNRQTGPLWNLWRRGAIEMPGKVKPAGEAKGLKEAEKARAGEAIAGPLEKLGLEKERMERIGRERS